MLGDVLEQLGKFGDPVPMYTQRRCLLDRHAVGGCDACFTACPHLAIEKSDFAIEVNPSLCTGCGICVSTCPTGALEYNLLDSLQYLADRKSGSAVIACEKSGAGETQLPCLARISPAVCSAAAMWEIDLQLVHGDCSACSTGSGDVPEIVSATVEHSQSMCKPAHKTVKANIRPAKDADRINYQGVSRRAAFRSLLRTTKQQLAKQIKPIPLIEESQNPKVIPEEWVWRKKALSASSASTIFWAAPLVNESCIDCPVCYNVCPTEAIHRDLQPDGGVRLLLDLSACTGCMACLRSCPPQAIEEQKYWHTEAFDSLLLLRESGSVM